MTTARRRAAAAALLVGVAFAFASCNSGPTTLRGKLQQWASGASFSSDAAQINADLVNLRNGYREQKLLALRTACEGFSADAATLYGQLPTPDQTITDELGSSLNAFFGASVDCYQSKTFSSAKFRQYLKLMRSATATYRRALSQLASDGVH